MISAGPEADTDTLLSDCLGCGLSVSGNRPLREGLVVEKNLGLWIEAARRHWLAIGRADRWKIELLIAVVELRGTNGVIVLLELRISLESAPRVMMADIIS